MLIGMSLVQEVVETILLTGAVKGAHPISLLLIADPEHGKTSVVLEKPSENVMVLTDVTGRGIQQLCQTMPQVTHFVINDMLAPGAKKQSVKQFTISMLCSMTEEGIRATAYPDGVKRVENGRRGIIACIPADIVNDGRAWWNKSGFSSRMLPFAYGHSEQLTIKIKNHINGEKFEPSWDQKDKVAFNVPKAPIQVKLPAKEREQIRKLADHRSKVLGEKGYRRLKQYRVVAAAHAIRRGWKNPQVTQKDIEFLMQLDGFVSYTNCKEI